MNQFWTQLVAQLTSAAAIVGIAAYLGKLISEHMFKAHLERLKAELHGENDKELAGVKAKFEKELLEAKHQRELQEALYEKQLESEAAATERIRAELQRWANPILNSVDGLERRLRNILNRGYTALDSEEQLDPQWSVSHDYFMTSTLYLFGQYFCWVQMLLEEINFELFRSEKEKDAFLDAMWTVSKLLGDNPGGVNGTGIDKQVFKLQQRAMGEALAFRQNGRASCMSYREFCLQLPNAAFTALFRPLRTLIEAVKPGERRWTRLEATQKALSQLKIQCKSILNIPDLPSQ
jgi:hypothetical protein